MAKKKIENYIVLDKDECCIINHYGEIEGAEELLSHSKDDCIETVKSFFNENYDFDYETLVVYKLVPVCTVAKGKSVVVKDI